MQNVGVAALVRPYTNGYHAFMEALKYKEEGGHVSVCANVVLEGMHKSILFILARISLLKITQVIRKTVCLPFSLLFFIIIIVVGVIVDVILSYVGR